MSDFKHYVIMGAGIAVGLMIVGFISGTLGKGLKL